MNKQARLLALLLAFATPLGYAPSANAMSNMCGRVHGYLANSDNVGNWMYSWWLDYYSTYCDASGLG